MNSSIVPQGFEVTAHPIFSLYKPPSFSSESHCSSESHGSSESHCSSESHRELAEAQSSDVNQVDRASCEDDSLIGPSTSVFEGPSMSVVAGVLQELDWKCPICLIEMSDPVTICGCVHTFCKSCLEHWLRVKEACPLCNIQVLAYLTAEPGSSSQKLFSRNTETAKMVSVHGAIPGLSAAVRVQAALYSKKHADVSSCLSLDSIIQRKRVKISDRNTTEHQQIVPNSSVEVAMEAHPTLRTTLEKLDAAILEARELVNGEH